MRVFIASKFQARSHFRHRRPSLRCEELFFSLLFIYFYASVQRNVTYTADIHYFKATEFEYAKRTQARLSENEGDVLQRFELIKVCIERNGNQGSTSWVLWSWIRMLSEINWAILDTFHPFILETI